MASIIRVGQSKFVIVPIDEDSSERIMNCIQTLSELQDKPVVHEIFLKDTKAAYSKMINAQEKKAAEKKESESAKTIAIQVDDLLSFRQFSKKSADDVLDVSWTTAERIGIKLTQFQDAEDVGRATGAGEVHGGVCRPELLVSGRRYKLAGCRLAGLE